MIVLHSNWADGGPEYPTRTILPETRGSYNTNAKCIVVTKEEWEEFVSAVKRGDFDYMEGIL